MVPVLTYDTALEEEEDIAAETYTINQIRKYLDGGYFDKARTKLAGRRTISHER